MLRTGATADEIAGLRRALHALAVADPGGFSRLFEPGGMRARVEPGSPEVAGPLLSFGLCEGRPDELWGLHRVRIVGDRYYVLELAGGRAEYVQDVWPETDALLAVLDGAPAARLCDIGTGSGVVAVEAARRGHAVVATDLYPSALELARFNARLNGVEDIDFRAGHLFEPVAGEQFDLVLTAPHYGRTADQLRLEVLRGSLAHLRPGGSLCLATALEWDEPGRLGVGSVLEPLVAAGAMVTVEPIRAALKREWFAAACALEPMGRLVSRHRFMVTVAAPTGAGGRQSIRWPAADDLRELPHVPLARLSRGSEAIAGVVDGGDVGRLRQILDALRAPEAVLEPPLPTRLLDGCRFGLRRCVGEKGAAGAIVDARGEVRPCTHGGAVARAEDPQRVVVERLEALAREAEARRGCPSCPAREVCSRCLFPTPLDEGAYCDLVRAHAAELPLLHRLVSTVNYLPDLTVPLTVHRWPRPSTPAPHADHDERLVAIARRWNGAAAWTVAASEVWMLFFLRDGNLQMGGLDESTALVGERIADGWGWRALEALAREQRLGPRAVERALPRLHNLFS
jgi:2-polyprenyl-3-methyl-5-hydroxy-6-metoxy-1,4-benzoquinol methylase